MSEFDRDVALLRLAVSGCDSGVPLKRILRYIEELTAANAALTKERDELLSALRISDEKWQSLHNIEESRVSLVRRGDFECGHPAGLTKINEIIHSIRPLSCATIAMMFLDGTTHTEALESELATLKAQLTPTAADDVLADIIVGAWTDLGGNSEDDPPRSKEQRKKEIVERTAAHRLAAVRPWRKMIERLLTVKHQYFNAAGGEAHYSEDVCEKCIVERAACALLAEEEKR